MKNSVTALGLRARLTVAPVLFGVRASNSRSGVWTVLSWAVLCCAVLCCAVLLAACQTPTQLLVVVSAPDVLTARTVRVALEINGQPQDQLEGISQASFPVSFGVRPSAEGPSEDVAIAVILLAEDGSAIGSGSATGTFAEGTKRTLLIHVSADGAPDGGVPDGGAPDGGAPDGGAPDGGAPDGGAPDGGPPDGGGPDIGVDTFSGDTGTDSGETDSGPDARPACPEGFFYCERLAGCTDPYLDATCGRDCTPCGGTTPVCAEPTPGFFQCRPGCVKSGDCGGDFTCCCSDLSRFSGPICFRESDCLTAGSCL